MIRNLIAMSLCILSILGLVCYNVNKPILKFLTHSASFANGLYINSEDLCREAPAQIPNKELDNCYYKRPSSYALPPALLPPVAEACCFLVLGTQTKGPILVSEGSTH